jgi:aryl-alcohol dehydrogenase-like predicted oxidoreductase
MLRLKPADTFFHAARERQVGIIARVPLASGLLTGKLRPETQFDPNDHRTYNRNGEAFDKGETFAGVDYEAGLRAVEALRREVPQGATMAQLALRWITQFPEVTTTIPGAKKSEQVTDNVRAAELPSLDESTLRRVREVYDTRVRALVHQHW